MWFRFKQEEVPFDYRASPVSNKECFCFETGALRDCLRAGASSTVQALATDPLVAARRLGLINPALSKLCQIIVHFRNLSLPEHQVGPFVPFQQKHKTQNIKFRK